MLSTAQQTAFAQGLLRYAGAPVTPQSVDWLRRWFAREGTAAGWNPTATTQHWTDPTTGQTSAPLPGNSAGVQQYPTMQAGIEATWATINNGRYPRLVMALHSGNPAAYDASGMLAPDLSTWSGGGYTSVIGAAPRDGNGNAGAGGQDAAFGIPGFPAVPLVPGTLGLQWLWDHSGPVKGTVDTASSLAKGVALIAAAVTKFAVWVADPHHWARIGEVLAGAIAGYLGLKLLSQVDGLGVIGQVAGLPSKAVAATGRTVKNAASKASEAAAVAAAA